MKNSRFFWRTFVFIFVLGFNSGYVFACQCGPTTFTVRFQEADAVFAGKIMKIKIGKKHMYYEATFFVEKIWKGKVGQFVIITTGSGMGDCGYYFKKRESYLVYAYNGKKGFYTDTCTGTALLKNASADLAILGAGRKPGATKKL